MITCFTYWNDGYSNMSPIIKYIYDYNTKKSKQYKFNLILLTDKNINNYISVPSSFFDLNSEFKSEIVRFFVLDIHGGIWLNPDVIIIKNLNILYNTFINSGKQVMLDIEFYDRIGCSSIIMLPKSKCSKYCVEYINNILNTTNNLLWDDIGHNTVTSLYESYPELIMINDYEKVKKGTNIVCWDQKPEVFNKAWIKDTIDEAKQTSDSILNDQECYYVITWTIYKLNDINIVFNNHYSIFYYFINNKNDSIYEIEDNIINEIKEVYNIKNKNNNLYYIIIVIIIFLFIIFYLYNHTKLKIVSY